MDEMPGDLQAPNPSGDVQSLNRYEPHQAVKQLGILTAPDGNMEAQRTHLLNKAQDFANNIKRQGMLSKNEVWQNMTHTISRTLDYPMPSTTLTLPPCPRIAARLDSRQPGGHVPPLKLDHLV